MPPENTLIPENSLITKTPEEGRALAMKMSRLIIKSIQPSEKVRKDLRPKYAEDPKLLIFSAQVVATEFATIAKANNYWKN